MKKRRLDPPSPAIAQWAMTASQPDYFPPVSHAEAGQKLLSFLSRRLGTPQSALHRWIRSGQIRINGHRCKPFARLEPGDTIRLPPQALAELAAKPGNAGLPQLPLDYLSQEGGIWAINKPAGLAVQGGTGQADSICARLEAQFSHSAFLPAPAHRLDKDTSGVLLTGASYEALRQLHEWFACGQIHKEYLCWIQGRWQGPPRLLRHWLTDARKDGNMTAHDNPAPGGQLALCFAMPIAARNNYSLLQIRLFTGRKRQIRAQLAASGRPIAGDKLYGGPPLEDGLKLHCMRMTLPDGREFSCLPPWTGNFRVDSLPPLLNNGRQQARAALAEGVDNV